MKFFKKGFYKFVEKIAYRKRLSIIEEALQLKRSILIKDELNFTRPINISVVIPTFLTTAEDLYGYRYEVIRNELIILDQLLSKGLIDEVIVVDGSRTKKMEVDESLAKRLILSAYRKMSLFHDQVNMLNKFSVLKDKAKLGFYEFVFKIIHQLDSQVNMITKQLNILSEGVPIGKGAALWLGVGISSGDIIVFLDSDIKNLEEWQVAALIKPLLKTFKDEKVKVELTKAYYTRLSINIDAPEKGFYKIGGRVTRLFLTPLLKVLSRRGFLSGLEKLKYPLSGEFAGKRSFLESLNFPANYSVETGILIELWKRKMLEKIVEVDLNLFQHFPRSEDSMKEMVKEITQLLLYELKECKIDVNKEEVVKEYLQEAYKIIELSQSLYDKAEVKAEVNQKVRRAFYKDTEGDKERVSQYAEVLKKEMAKSNAIVKPVKMPSWRDLIKTLEGQKLQNFLKRKAIIYTLELLDKSGIIKI